jgi:cell division protein ZapD
VLRLLRESGKSARQLAAQGTSADDGRTRGADAAHSLVPRIRCVPEISANKYALNIRFMTISSAGERPKTAEYDGNSS